MKIKTLISVGALAAVLAGCGGSDGITLSPTNISNGGGDNGGGNGDGSYNGPCAYYEANDSIKHGSVDELTGNCEYNSSFVGENNPLVTGTMVIPALPNGRVHVFHDSLFIGEDVGANSGRTVPQEGEGAVVEIEAGALIAFSGSDDYVRITRGSQIFAEGRANAPIIFSGEKDLVDGSANEGDRGLWGGMQINGNGITNKCNNTERSNGTCHVEAEGKPATYGGNNNEESSGVLRYVQIRHAGFEVVDGDELNGLTLNAVGSGTTIEYVQTYTTQDDGFEMFGGAVNLKNIVAVNIGDDAIDFSEGWQGNIQYALVVNTSGANTCIEADNNSTENAQEPFTKGRISNMTCVTSAVNRGEGDFPSTKGSSEGPIFREGAYFELYNSIITSNALNMFSNECMEVVSDVSIAGVESGYSVAKGNVIACSEPFAGYANLRSWWEADNAVVDVNLPATVIEGLSETNPRAYITAATLQDSAGDAISYNVHDVTVLADDFEPNAAPAEGSTGDSSFFENVDFIGAVKAGDDWASAWTTGL